MLNKKKSEEERKAHMVFQDTIRKRYDALASKPSDWWPFTQNMEDILEKIDYIIQRFDDIENEIGEVDGRIKNLRKVLIKLEVIDDRFVF